MGNTLASKLDAFNLMQCVCRVVAFSTAWAGHNRHIFDHQEFPSLAVAPSDFPNQRILASTDIADHVCFISSCGRCHRFETDQWHFCSHGDEVQLFETDDLSLVILHEDDVIAGFFAQVFLIRFAEPHRQRVADRIEEKLYFRFHMQCSVFE